MSCGIGILKPADGSAYFQQGNTQVLVSVYGPRETTLKSHIQHDRAILNVEINVAAFSTIERKRRNKTDKRLLELAHSIQSTFESSLFTHLYPRSQIDINIQVIQQDGALLATACNATTLALVNAGIPMSNYVSAVSVAAVDVVSSAQTRSNTVDTHVILDLTYQEESDLAWYTIGALMPGTIPITSNGVPKSEPDNTDQADNTMQIDQPVSSGAKFCLLQSETKMNLASFEKCLETGLGGCQELYTFMDEQIRTSTSQTVRRTDRLTGAIKASQMHLMETQP